MQQSTPPEGIYTAILVEGSCGVTTSASTHVVLRSAEYGDFIPIFEGGKTWSKPHIRQKSRHGKLRIEYRGLQDG